MNSNDVIKQDGDTVIFEVKEFLGDHCTTSSIVARLSIARNTYNKKQDVSLEGCVHLCDGSSLVTWSIYDSDKPRLLKTADEFERMAAVLLQFAAHVRASVDFVGEFDIVE